MESSGPDVKIRGNATQLFEKYQALARDAVTSGDRIAAENYLQHAEHYYRVLSVQSAQNADSLSGPRPRGSRDRDRESPSPSENAAIAEESQETPGATPAQTSS